MASQAFILSNCHHVSHLLLLFHLQFLLRSSVYSHSPTLYVFSRAASYVKSAGRKDSELLQALQAQRATPIRERGQPDAAALIAREKEAFKNTLRDRWLPTRSASLSLATTAPEGVELRPREAVGATGQQPSLHEVQQTLGEARAEYAVLEEQYDIVLHMVAGCQMQPGDQAGDASGRYRREVSKELTLLRERMLDLNGDVAALCAQRSHAGFSLREVQLMESHQEEAKRSEMEAFRQWMPQQMQAEPRKTLDMHLEQIQHRSSAVCAVLMDARRMLDGVKQMH